jgi:hypothetical protein
MQNLLLSIEKERAFLRRIPAFDPRFRKAYGYVGSVAIGVLALCILGLGVWWLAPWNPGYLPSEKKNIWLGVVVMPFAAFLVSTFIVEFILKLIHIAVWAGSGVLSVPMAGKVAACIFSVLVVTAGVLPTINPELDLWGYLALFFSISALYVFMSVAWDATYAKLTPS